MKKSTLQKIMRENTILECEVENAIDFVSDLLDAVKKDMEVNEPYAFRSINAFEMAGCVVRDLCFIISEDELEND